LTNREFAERMSANWSSGNGLTSENLTSELDQ
jgi:hypothetical protein